MIPDLDSGIMPDLEEWVRLVGSRDVLNLTGLSGDQLREWTVRRGLISPDVPASRQGQQAQFGWQTVLLLRLAVVLRALLQTWGTAARRHPVGGLGSIGEMLIEHNHGFGQGRGSNSECSFNQAHLPHDTWLQAPCLGLSFA